MGKGTAWSKTCKFSGNIGVHRVKPFISKIIPSFHLLRHPTTSIPEGRPIYSWETDHLSTYLDDVWQQCKDVSGLYAKVASVLSNSMDDSNDSASTIQDLCNILYSFPSLLRSYDYQQPEKANVTLSDDFEYTHLVAIHRRDEVQRRAAFGLINTDSGKPADRSSDACILHLLRTALLLQEREEAILTLRGGDARRTLDLIQELLDRSESWERFIRMGPTEQTWVAGGKQWRRLRRLLVKLAAACHQVPSSILLSGVRLESPESVGCGSFADIYRGKYQGQTVALKRLRVFATLPASEVQMLNQELYGEALIWRQLKHPYIMPFLGIDCDTFPVGEMPKCIVLPWAHFGSIRQCINRLEENSQSIPASRWVSEIAEGLAYLHGEGVMHGDLRGANVLINEECGVQLSDFGLSDLVKTRTASVSRVFPEGVTSRWMAPELLQYDFVFPVESSSDLDQSGEARPTFAADVYAFACVCVEIYSGEDPQFPGIPAQGRGLSRAVEKAVKSGIRPLRPSTERRTMPDELWSIVETCWRQNATDRPSASEVVRTLKGLEASSQ